jgi:acyl-CoA thioesterase
MWARFADLDANTTALAILGDLVGFGVSQALGDWAHGSSLDNTLRIVRLVPTDWILLDIRVHGVANGYGHGNVHLWTASRRRPGAG